MSFSKKKDVYLPQRDRSFWKCDEVLDLPLLYLGWGHRNFNQDPIPLSSHDGWICTLIEEGCPTLTMDNQSVLILAGMLVMIGPECSFGWKDSTRRSCKFLSWTWRSFKDANLRVKLNTSYVIQSLNQDDRKRFVLLHNLCRWEVLHLTIPERTYLEGCQLICEATALHAIESEQCKHQQDSEWKKMVKGWICTHFDSKEPIARLCDYLNLTQSSLYRLFKAEFGTSPLAYFHQLRMERAEELLNSSNLSIKEIAFQVGYKHFNDLSRSYRKYFGYPPTNSRPRPVNSTPAS